MSVDAEALSSSGVSGDARVGGHQALRRLGVVHPDESLDAALRQLARQPVVPVVSRLDQDVLIGTVTLEDVHAAYGLAKRVP